MAIGQPLATTATAEVSYGGYELFGSAQPRSTPLEQGFTGAQWRTRTRASAACGPQGVSERVPHPAEGIEPGHIGVWIHQSHRLAPQQPQRLGAFSKRDPDRRAAGPTAAGSFPPGKQLTSTLRATVALAATGGPDQRRAVRPGSRVRIEATSTGRHRWQPPQQTLSGSGRNHRPSIFSTGPTCWKAVMGCGNGKRLDAPDWDWTHHDEH